MDAPISYATTKLPVLRFHVKALQFHSELPHPRNITLDISATPNDRSRPDILGRQRRNLLLPLREFPSTPPCPQIQLDFFDRYPYHRWKLSLFQIQDLCYPSCDHRSTNG